MASIGKFFNSLYHQFLEKWQSSNVLYAHLVTAGCACTSHIYKLCRLFSDVVFFPSFLVVNDSADVLLLSLVARAEVIFFRMSVFHWNFLDLAAIYFPLLVFHCSFYIAQFSLIVLYLLDYHLNVVYGCLSAAYGKMTEQASSKFACLVLLYMLDWTKRPEFYLPEFFFFALGVG